MKKQKPKKFDIAKAGVISGLLIAAVMGGFILFETPNMLKDSIGIELSDSNPVEYEESDEGSTDIEGDENEQYEESWNTVASWEPGLTPLGEVADPGGDGTGFASIFLLDYGEDPSTLGVNATDWSASAVVHAYADSDDFSEDCPSEDPFYIVVRARFTKAVCYDEGDSQFVGNRTKCTITFSGDGAGTITHYGNHTESASGGGICSDNDSGGASLWVNYYFDDGDGYKLTDDGSLTVSLIEISAKY